MNKITIYFLDTYVNSMQKITNVYLCHYTVIFTKTLVLLENLLLNLLFCIIGLRLPAAEDDDDAEEEATTLELFETVGRKTIVVIVEDALDAIMFSRSVFVFSLSLSLNRSKKLVGEK